ncbi:MAG: prepilin-type N-terminal cleavage/methylation domain-containing protein, partial [Parcubacteria group bacterium]|nr:prepilin-type N-terminal cleavage/methylation domain-containing protein [Parcubacteria group bacterium]
MKQRGLTLLEVLIALSIGSVILLTVLAVMRQITFLSEKTVDDSRFYRELNRKIEEMVRDIRSSQVDYVAYGCPVTNSPAWTSPYCV